MKPNIKFELQRNFGEIFNDSFSFVSQEFKKLVKSLFYFTGPFILIGTTCFGISQYSLFSGSSNLLNQSISGQFSLIYFIGIFFLFFGVIMLMNTVYSYIKLYTENGYDNFTVENVWYEVKQNFWNIFLTNFLLTIIYAVSGLISILFIMIPFIYLSTATIFVVPIKIFEKKTFKVAFSRSFYLIKNRWWFTFGLIILSSLVINILSAGISLPLTTISGIITYSTELAEDNKLWSIIMLIYYSLAIISYYILFSVIFIIITFQYFNLLEEKEHPSLFERIKEINNENISMNELNLKNL